MPVLQNANEFIEQQLGILLADLENELDSDVITFSGELIPGVDDILRNVIENKRSISARPRRLAMLVTTPGGYIDVVKRIVETIRYHYDHVSFLVPNYAFSAGTVLAMSGDCIYMDYYSRLGPIDPQRELDDGHFVPALGYLIQWDRLVEKAKNGDITPAEVYLMVQGFDQAVLYQYDQERELSIALLTEWLAKYKFKDWTETATRKLPVTPEMREQRAKEIASSLNDTGKWHSHGHGISMEILKKDLNLQYR